MTNPVLEKALSRLLRQGHSVGTACVSPTGRILIEVDGALLTHNQIYLRADMPPVPKPDPDAWNDLVRHRESLVSHMKQREWYIKEGVHGERNGKRVIVEEEVARVERLIEMDRQAIRQYEELFYV